MSLIHRPIHGLGSRVVASSVTFRRSGVLYDYALSDLGLLAATSAKYPYQRATAPFRKEQFDASDNPGEQSLTSWWLRSQSTFHFGAGINYMEPASDDEVMGAFHSSQGVDPWTAGQLSLLKKTTLKNAASGDLLLLGAVDGSTDIFLQAEGATLARETDAGTSSVTWGGANTIRSLTEDGANYYAADDVGIYKGTLAGGAGSLIWNTGDTDVVIGWAKQRLVAGIGPSVYELVTGGPTLPTALYTHPTASWKWSSITEGPTAIYLAGYAGAQSAIYKFALGTDGAMPTLTSGVIAATLPTGEIVHSIYAYIGAYIAIGTNKGVRIGIIAENGDIAYGPLIIESTEPVRSFVGKDRFIFAGCTDQIEGASGLWRIDLGTEKKDGRFPYATDLQSGVTGDVTAVTMLGASGRLVFGVSASGSYLEHATDLVTSGWVQTGLVRYNTVEPKRFEFVKAKILDTGTVGVEVVDENGSATSVASLDASLGDDYALYRSGAEVAVALRFTLNQATATTGPRLISWQLKSQPAVARQRLIKVPVLLFESMRDGKGKALPPVDVHAVLAALEDMEDDAEPILFSELCHNPSRTELVVIDEIEFQQSAPPARCEGDGGILYLTLRTVQ